MKPLLLLLLALWAAVATAQSTERWNRLITAESRLAREMSRVNTLLAYTDLADTIAVIQGQLRPADADARLQATSRQAFVREVSEADLAAARNRLGSAIAGYLNASGQAVDSSQRWPGGAPMQARAKRVLAAVGSSYPGWLQENLDPGVLLSQVALVVGWARGEANVLNPFAAHVQRMQASYPDNRTRIRAAAAANLTALDGKPAPATPIAPPSPSVATTTPTAPPTVVRPPPPATTIQLPPPTSCQGFAGAWETDFGPLPLNVQGNRVAGSYTRPGGNIDGQINGNQLDGRWMQRDRWGLLRFVLAPDGRSFSGRWTDANGSGGGAWNGHCASASSAQAQRFEVDVDRPGMDLANFILAQADPSQCLAACQANGNCRAFTFVKPGVQGPQARCWLKSGVPAPVRSACCVSGMR